MESKKQGFDIKTVKACLTKIKQEITAVDAVNTLMLLCLFIFYTLTFFVPKFYGMTEKYVGVFVFVILAVISVVNINPVKKLKEKDKDLIALIALAVIAAINIVIVDSGYGCFFVVTNFALICYLSSHIPFHRWQLYLFGGLYTLMIIYWFFGVYTWMFADYTSFAMNTNTAATFTVFSMMYVLVFFEELYRKNRTAGLIITIALVKCLQISLYHRSRGAFIMLGAFLVLRFIVPKKLWAKKAFYNAVCIFATLGSLVFVAVYILVGTSGVNFRMPFFYKNIFSGREAIWLEFWNLFKKSPLTGIGTNVTITSFFEYNVHNAMYNILVIHGVIVFALVLFLLYRNWNGCRGNASLPGASACAFIALMAVCIESFFDVDLIWTDYSVNALLLMLTANMRPAEEDEHRG
ncbi:MAG: O-antigen ligase family protein [Lachnospiraceae bacterium]|nr:O-antigen ligase family protein [Lachnospiraceae bacterium]